MPDSATVSGLDGALLATDSDPDADPLAVGANFTLTVQDPPAAMELPQVFVWLNGPLTLTEDTDAAVLPGLVTVTVCAELVEPTARLPNETLDGDAVSALLVLVVPVPDSATVSGLDGALLATDSDPLAAPLAVGANVTLTVHEAPAAMDDPQVFVWLNGPLTLTEDTDAAVLPGLVTVTDCAPLVDPTAWFPNDTLDGDAVRGLLVPPPPEPGKTSNSASCAADQPVLAVKLSSTYRSLVPDGSWIVTELLLVDGLKVYPADPTIWVNVVLLVLPSTDSVSVRVLHADDGGRSRVIDPIDWTDPRSTVIHCG